MRIIYLFVIFTLIFFLALAMDTQLQKELIVKNALEVLQNVLPTNIMENLERLDAEDDSNRAPDDMDEDRFFYEYLATKTQTETLTQPVQMPQIVPKAEPLDNDSLTYFEIVEQEMMQSLPVTKYNIEVWQSTSQFDYFCNRYKI